MTQHKDNQPFEFRSLAPSPASSSTSALHEVKIGNHHVRPYFIQGMKSVVKMQIQAGVARQMIDQTVLLDHHALKQLDATLGRAFDLFYDGSPRSEAHQELLKRFIEVRMVQLLDQINGELAAVNQRLATIAATALVDEDIPSFFARLFGRS